MLFLLVVAAIAATGCGEALGPDGGPQIVSLSIDPSEISLSDTGMTDEYFTATIQVSGFQNAVDVDQADVFVEAGGDTISAEPGTRDIQGDTITLGMIAKSWLGGLDAGDYGVGAEVQSSTEKVRELDLATITITE